MTFFYADIASYQAGLSLSGLPAVCVKATEGTTYIDPDYAGWKSEADTKGVLFSAYHYLDAVNPAEQAQFCFNIVGDTPLMIDVEALGTVDSVSTIETFESAFTALGGRVWGYYIPLWYWEGNMGSPDLSGLPGALVASDYADPYSDSGVGWDSYGGKSPVVWQVTNSHLFNGQPVDWDAFRGTVEDLSTLWYGAQPSNSNVPQEVLNVSTLSRDDGSLDLTIATHPAPNHIITIDSDQFPVTLRVVTWNAPGETPMVTNYAFPGANYTIHLENDPKCIGMSVTTDKPVKYSIGPVYS